MLVSQLSRVVEHVLIQKQCLKQSDAQIFLSFISCDKILCQISNEILIFLALLLLVYSCSSLLFDAYFCIHQAVTVAGRTPL